MFCHNRKIEAGCPGELVPYHCSGIGQERFDLGFGGEEVLTGPHAVETNKPHDPVHVGSLGVNGVVVQTEYLSDLIEEFWLLTFCRVRHIRLP